MKLKNGTRTNDERCDRLVQFDERSRAYRIRDLVPRKRRSYTWRCNQTLNQGSEGACVGFAVAHEFIARPAEVRGIGYRFARDSIYWEAQKIDPWPGGSYPGARPRYEGTSVLAGVQIAQRLGYCEEYRWSFSISDLLLGLGYHGPAILGVNWYDSMYTPDEDGFIRPRGSIVGGHAILARAVNVRDRYVTLRNSWGSRWGDAGDCRMTFDALEDLLAEDGEAVFLVRRKTKGA